MIFPEKDFCVFCKIIEKGHEVFLENDLAVAFFDSFPLNPGHTLIIPKRHEPDYFALSGEEQQALFSLLPLVQEQTKDLSPDGYNLGMNIGSLAGQTVPHVHLHLIPRFSRDTDPLRDGSFDPRGGIRWTIHEKAAYWD